jgi:hypothetical protein
MITLQLARNKLSFDHFLHFSRPKHVIIDNKGVITLLHQPSQSPNININDLRLNASILQKLHLWQHQLSNENKIAKGVRTV